MKIIYPTGQDVQFYGRNPDIKAIGGAFAGVAPHGPTIRATYTVPAGKRCVLTSLFTHIYRVTVAAPVGLFRVWGLVNLSGSDLWICGVTSISNTVGFIGQSINPSTLWLDTGDIIAFYTSDVGTGGTCDYFLTATMLEFVP
jgi:hypothetical protein